MKLFNFIWFVIIGLLVCFIFKNVKDLNENRPNFNHKTFKAGFFQDAWNTIKDLFDGDGNVNGTPGDPYKINLGAGSHGSSSQAMGFTPIALLI